MAQSDSRKTTGAIKYETAAGFIVPRLFFYMQYYYSEASLQTVWKYSHSGTIDTMSISYAFLPVAPHF